MDLRHLGEEVLEEHKLKRRRSRFKIDIPQLLEIDRFHCYCQ